MKTRLKYLFLLLFSCLSQKSFSQETAISDENFHTLFRTTGYITALGAALGTAVMGLTEEPTNNLKFIAVGASLGFITGSLLGGYFMVAPVMSVSAPAGLEPPSAYGDDSSPAIAFEPIWSFESNQVTGLRSSFRLLNF